LSFLEPGPPLRVKICGLTNPADAETALAAGTAFHGVPADLATNHHQSAARGDAVGVAARRGPSGGLQDFHGRIVPVTVVLRIMIDI
jgi:hypothetical protein